MDRSILSFSGQLQSAEGLLVTADDFVIEDQVENTIGDTENRESTGHYCGPHRMDQWSGPENGAYGIYRYSPATSSVKVP